MIKSKKDDIFLVLTSYMKKLTSKTGLEEKYMITDNISELLQDDDFLAFNVGYEIYDKFSNQPLHTVSLEKMISNEQIKLGMDMCLEKDLDVDDDVYDKVRGMCSRNGSIYRAVHVFEQQMELAVAKDVLKTEEKGIILEKSTILSGVYLKYLMDRLSIDSNFTRKGLSFNDQKRQRLELIVRYVKNLEEIYLRK